MKCNGIKQIQNVQFEEKNKIGSLNVTVAAYVEREAAIAKEIGAIKERLDLY